MALKRRSADYPTGLAEFLSTATPSWRSARRAVPPRVRSPSIASRRLPAAVPARSARPASSTTVRSSSPAARSPCRTATAAAWSTSVLAATPSSPASQRRPPPPSISPAPARVVY
jgi:hypothetical protein